MSTLAPSRHGRLIDRLRLGAALLLYEFFACTNEREGSQIARDIVDSLVVAGTRVCYVTHRYSLSHGLAQQHVPEHLFLRAQRDADGRRSLQLTPGDPESTSHAGDLFHQVFADS